MSFIFPNHYAHHLVVLLNHTYTDDNGKRQVETDTSTSQIVLPVSLFREGVDARFYLVHYIMSTLFPLSGYLMNNNFTIASPVLGVSVVGNAGVDLTEPVIITLHIQIDVSESWYLAYLSYRSAVYSVWKYSLCQILKCTLVDAL